MWKKNHRIKYVYKIKCDDNDQVEQYRVRLVVKGYAKKKCINFNDIFSLVIRLTTIKIVLAICVVFNLNLEHLDMKTVFFYRELKEKMYIL